MPQQIINISNIGDPAVQTGFTQTNQNFTQVWAAGPVDSNIQITDNTIQSTNLNGNINLATTGIGVVVVGTNFVPDRANARMLGSASTPFNTVYTQYFNAQGGTVTGNLYVPGNLFVSGNTIYVNHRVLNIGNSTINLSANALYPAMADGSGLHVVAADANFTYSAINSTWNSNLPLVAPQFIGDGSQLTNVSALINGTSLSGNVLSANVLFSNLQQVGTLANLTVSDYVSATGNITGDVITGQYLVGDGSNIYNIPASAVIGGVGNSHYSTFAGTAETANLAALSTQSINADNALYALNADKANTANVAIFAQTSNIANTACMADVANSAVVAGMAETVGILTSLTVTGNILAGNVTAGNITGTLLTASQPYITSLGTLSSLAVSTTVSATNVSLTGNIFANAYYYANGTPFIGGGGSNYSNANVAAFMPIYSGDLNTVYNLSAYGNVGFANSVTVTNSLTSSSIFSSGYYYANGTPLGTSTNGVFGDQQFNGANFAGPYPLLYATDNNNVIVSVNGLTMAPVTFYNIVGNSILFTDSVETTDLIDIRYLGQGSVLGDQQFYGDNTTGPFSLLQTATANSVIVTVNGLTQSPGLTYTVAGNTITFNSTVDPAELVNIRFLAVGNTGGSNWIANTITFNDNSVQSTAFTPVDPPASSVGQPGDKQGMIAYDVNYWYWCTADYDGFADVWVRTAITSGPW